MAFNNLIPENCGNARNQYWTDNPDVKNANVDPYIHYITSGKTEGRKWKNEVCRPIDCDQVKKQYLVDNPDVKNANIDPLTHYVNNGRAEGRMWKNELCSAPAPAPQNTSVSGAITKAVTTSQSVIPIDCTQARNQYLIDNPDVKNANVDPYAHYKNNGMKEGRKWKNELCSTPAPTSSVSALPAEPVYRNIKHKATGECLDGNGSTLYFGGCQADNDYQNWKPVPAQPGYNNIVHKATGGCLDGNGSTLYFGGCQADNDYQNWKLIPAQNGYFNYQHKASGKCLDGNGSTLYFGNCDIGNNYQNYSGPSSLAPQNCDKTKAQYLIDYPDVKNANVDPLNHYTSFGVNEGRKWKTDLCTNPVPSPENCEKAKAQYLNDNPDVKNANIDPFGHYLNNGIYEGRKWKNEVCSQSTQSTSSQNCEKVRTQYLIDNPDVKTANVDPLNHYTGFGVNEGRKWKTELCTNPVPSPENCEKVRTQYLNDNPDVKTSNIDPLAHYLNNGIIEGRKWKNELCTPEQKPEPNPEPKPEPKPEQNPEPVPAPPSAPPSALAPALTAAPAAEPDYPTQPFVLDDNTLYDKSKDILIDLYTAIVYVNRFTKTQMKGGYIEIPYFMPSATMRPNAFFINGVETNKYKCSNLYIFKASHNIQTDIKFDAEMVIELLPSTNTTEKLFLCFLLKTKRYTNEDKNDIDKLINISVNPPRHFSPVNFNLDQLINKTTTKIVYKSGIDNVIIFMDPISIAEVDFTSYNTIPKSLFSLYPVNKYNIIPSSVKTSPPSSIPLTTPISTIEGFRGQKKEGLDNSNTSTAETNNSNLTKDIESAFERNLISCTPVDENDVSLVKDETATYLVNSAQNKNTGQIAIGYSFIMIMLCIAIGIIGAPLFFYFTISKHITDGKRLTITTAAIFILLIILGLSLFMDGANYNSNVSGTGAFIIILLGLSVCGITIQRLRTTHIIPEFEMVSSFKRDFLPVLLAFLSGFENKNVLIIIAVCMAILTIILVSVGTTSVSNHRARTLLYSFGFIYGFIFSIWGAFLAQYGNFEY